jgi:hypothetical protein
MEKRLVEAQGAAIVVWLVAMAVWVGLAVWINWRLLLFGFALLWTDAAGGRADSAIRAVTMWRTGRAARRRDPTLTKEGP